jgi:hypothetical protein
MIPNDHIDRIYTALKKGIPITDPKFYSSEKDCPDSLIENVFEPASGCLEPIPLLKERIHVMRQAGAILVEVGPLNCHV